MDKKRKKEPLISNPPDKGRRCLKAVPVSALLICMTAFLLAGRSLTYQGLSDWLPENKVTAVAQVSFLTCRRTVKKERGRL